MTSQPGKQTIAVHILSNISTNKDRQKIKFGQLIEYHMRNLFLEKSCTKYGVETSYRDLFLKKLKLNISLDQQSKVSYRLFLLYPMLRAIEVYRILN